MKEFKQVTIGVDVFNDCLAIIVRGWDDTGGSSLIGKNILEYGGQPAFEELFGILNNGYDGHAIDVAFIDSGHGAFTHRIYRFCDIYNDKLIPVKGRNVTGMTTVKIAPEFNGQLLDLCLVTFSQKEFSEKARDLATDCFYVDDRFSDAEGLAYAAAHWLCQKTKQLKEAS